MSPRTEILLLVALLIVAALFGLFFPWDSLPWAPTNTPTPAPSTGPAWICYEDGTCAPRS
jgi:hypothetical protein